MEGLLGCNPPPCPKNQNLKNTVFVEMMISIYVIYPSAEIN